MLDDAAPVPPTPRGAGGAESGSGDARTETERAEDTPSFPADTHTLSLSAADLAVGGERSLRIHLQNSSNGVLHVRLASRFDGLRPVPSEVALGPHERQPVNLWLDTGKAQELARSGGDPAIPVQVVYQRLAPGRSGETPSPPVTGAIYVRLPFASCPACRRPLHDVQDGGDVPEVCPFCFERLRACPVCGTPNSWLARHCVRDESHVIRSAPDWPLLGAGSAHPGHVARAARSATGLALSRRWSFPSVAPASRESALTWSAPAAAYGLVAAAGATAQGDAHLYVFDTLKGALLWEPYPLNDPVYPERGGTALAGGRLYAATVDGDCVCVDAQRGTRIWERTLSGRIYGSIVPVGEDGPVLVTRATSQTQGCLTILNAMNGDLLHEIDLPGIPDTTPAAASGRAFVHDDSGTLSCIDLGSGRLEWQATCDGGFDAAPVVHGEHVVSASVSGTLFCHDARSGTQLWQTAITGVPLAGTPAHDGNLVYAPADDGIHLVTAQGRSVRRYNLSRPVRSAPIVVGDALLFGATDGRVYGAERGRPLQTLYETGTGSQIVAAPAMSDGALFVTATNGVLYALALG